MIITFEYSQYRHQLNKRGVDAASMARHQVNIDEAVYKELDRHRQRDGDWTESWSNFFRRVLRDGSLKK